MTRRPTSRTDLPLQGIRILLTRPEEDAQKMRARLESLGARVACLPTISIRATTDVPETARVLRHLEGYDWMVVTSRNAVRIVCEWLRTNNAWPMLPLNVAAVGPGTAEELGLHGIVPNCIPAEAGSQALASALQAAGVSGASVFLPLGDLAGDELRGALVSAGARVTAVRVYQTVAAQPNDDAALDALLRGEIDVVALASPSAFRNLLNLRTPEVGHVLPRTHLVAIGPTTADAIRTEGYRPSWTAARHTADGLVDAITALYETEQR